MAKEDDVAVLAAQVKARYGNHSDMWLHRLLKSDPTFPKPFYIGRLRYWWLSELLAWETALPGRVTKLGRVGFKAEGA